MKKIFFIAISLSVSLLSNLNAQFQNVQISSGKAQSPNEVTIAINPANPTFIAAGSNLNLFYWSADAGNSWQEQILSSVFGVMGDPAVVYDNDGKLYYSHLSSPGSNGYWIDRIVVQKSTNFGYTWDAGVGVGYSPPRKNQDKEWIAVDYSNSTYRNNIYMAWTEFDEYASNNSSDSTRILFSRSTDNAGSWSEPIKVSDREGDCIDDDNTVEGCVPAVGPNGEVYLSWSGPYGLMFDRSFDGGITFGNDIKVADLIAGWTFDVPGILRCNGLPVTGCDISDSPYKGNVYINWSDQIDGDTDIFFAKSTDNGMTWGAPKKVNNDILKRHQFFTWMCVDPKTGIIYIVFYDRRDNLDPSSVQTHVYIARSGDGGETFTNHRVSESPFFPDKYIFIGDYTNIAAYNGKIYPIWTRMDNTKLSVWTALIDD
ncbi:MAG: sialidase family protein, partial [Bacteroidota bacterium]